ncbi:hypothetical protein SKAU_G00329520 [Synaphobranchus kaupii]|uniref:Uncharacterized protein n=1 Tax=Synaphobranchus kaupii TaxID=118154 RepID=A0A9Q1EQF1_SYNKA|nr:hypothetical protein SKAU_G00329520 [Synaphobranchus kaupii]
MPVITPFDLVGKITANTAVLLAPLCYFNDVNCTSETCVIYLVPAIGSAKSFGTIDDGLGGRSPSMIAITTILSIILCLLLTLLIIALVYGSRHEPEPMTVLGSLRIRRYNTHHMKDPVPQVNPSFEGNMKRYTTSEVLPNVDSAVDHQNSVQLRRYKNDHFSEESQTT